MVPSSSTGTVYRIGVHDDKVRQLAHFDAPQQPLVAERVGAADGVQAQGFRQADAFVGAQPLAVPSRAVNSRECQTTGSRG